MIINLVITGGHKIKLDKKGRFKVKDVKTSLKEIPFIRYRFDKYDEECIEYMKEMKDRFKYSSHMAEIQLDENTKDVIESIDDKVYNIIKFIYIDIYNEEVDRGFSDDKLEILDNIKDMNFDRVMLRDKSDFLCSVTFNRLRKQVQDILIDGDNDWAASNIGICQSPLSLYGGNACLTAVIARELSAEYAENDQVALPSANHEDRNRCGCIKYVIVDKDIENYEISGGTGSKPSTVKRKPKRKGIIKW